jgi:hypothetical protein
VGWDAHQASGGHAIRLSTLSESRADRSAVIDECPMTENCPGFDRDLRMYLIRPGDCESNLADGEAALTFETPEALTPDASPDAGSR